MPRIRRTTLMLAGVLPAVALGSVVYPAGPPAPAQAHPAAANSDAATAFRIVAQRHFGGAGNASGYAVITVTGRGQAWVFGGTNPGGRSAPVAERWNGSSTLPSKLPPRLHAFISDAGAPSASDVWAASQYGRYVLNWNGQRWSVARTWRAGQITGLDAITARDVWVFGTPITGTGVLGTWHFDGRTWSAVRGRANSIIRASSLSRSDIWAVAGGGTKYSVLRFDGASWRPVNTGDVLLGVRPHDILAVSNQNVWIVANSASRATAGRLVLAHWNGRTWSKIVTGTDAWAGRLAKGPGNSVLITATPFSLAATGLILQVSAQGGVSTFGIESGQGSGISDVAVAGPGSALWATGGVLTRLGGDAAIWTGRLPGSVIARPANRSDRRL